ncbi:MAG: polyketide cyclase [Verrucomicrobiales bacterium]|nr:polyketide cyclase [Verrucomicrobiales bacterium]
MWKKILLVLAILIAVFIAVVAMQPGEFEVSRSAVIEAPVETVFPLVNDFHESDKWSPWADLDPNAAYEFSGAESGVGAKHSWSGNKEVGVGSQEIVKSEENKRIKILLKFEEPMNATSDVVYTFEPDGEKTKVTWTMSGENNFLGKAMSLFMDCDEMVGSQFEKGLASLNEVAKKSSESKLTPVES